MKQIQITEMDLKYRQELADFLIAQGAIPVVFEVPDDFDTGAYEGIALVEAGVAAQNKGAVNFMQDFADVVAWLGAYKGNFDFYLSLQSQFRAKGILSPKQIDAVRRAIDRDKASGINTPKGTVPNFSLSAGTTLVLGKFIANKIAKEAGHTRGHRVVDVISVEAETEKAYRAKVRLSARRTSHCGVCGLPLENPESVAAGIGPICADNNGISYGGSSIEELNQKLNTTVEVTTWIPKSSIKEKLNAEVNKSNG